MSSTLKESITKAFFSGQQELVLTLPKRLVLAFRSEFHKKYIDPQTNKPFTSFYRWLMAAPPPGCGLASSHYLKMHIIIEILTDGRDLLPESEKGPVSDLIEELVKGYGAAKPAGRPKKEIAPVPVRLNGHRKSFGRVDTLAARLAESTEPKIRKEWRAYLEGKHSSVTRAAIACGMIEDANAPLNRLKQNWRKASVADRRQFLKFIRDEEGAK